MLLDVRSDHLKIVQDVLQRHVPDREVWAFGSRAKWLAKEYSDLDLCVLGETPLGFRTLGLLEEAFDESDLPYKVDVVDWATTSEAFRKIIERDKVVVKESTDVLTGWPLVPLGELTVNFDPKRKPVKESERKRGPYPYYGASGIVDHVDGYIFEGEHLLIAEDGENLRSRQTPIAFMAQGKFWVNNHAHIVTGNERASTRYLLYALQDINIDPYLTGAVMPKLTQGNLNKILLPCPSLAVQDKIVGILGSLDDKIALLRETNTTLEAIAQTLFKSWFIDFDPVRAKMEGREPEGMDAATAALFPDSFEDSELGEIPKGWHPSTMDGVSVVGIGKTPPRKEPQWFSADNGDVRWVSIRDMGVSGAFISQTSEYLTAESIERFNVRLVPDNTVLLSFKMTIGRVAITNGEMTTNEAIAHFKLDEMSPLTSEYIYLHLKLYDYASLSSTSSIADAVNSKTVKSIPILVPHKKVVLAFQELIRPVFKKIKQSQQQMQSLVTLRDTLLPRLMSGKLCIPSDKSKILENPHE